MRLLLPALLLLLATAGAADEMVIGGDSTITRRGNLVAIFDGRAHREVIFTLDRVVMINSSREGQPGSTTDITVGSCGFSSANTVIRIPERVIPYASIRTALMK